MTQPNNNDVDVEVLLSDPQDAILNCRKAVILDMAGQGAGKTGTISYLSGLMIEQFPKADGFIGANTYGQLSTSTLKGVFRDWERVFGWKEYHPISNPAGDYVVDKVPPMHFTKRVKLKEYRNVISFRSGTLVYLGSLENYKAHDGKEFAWAHLDETKDTKEEALTDVILGRLRQIGIWYDEDGELHYEANVEIAQAKGWTAWNPCYIHTSPAIGVAEWINDMFELNPFEEEIREAVYKKADDFFYREFKNKAVVIYSSYHNARNLPPNFLDNQLQNLKAGKADKLIFGLPFSKTGGEFYPSFERRDHVRKVGFLPQTPVHLSFDFNSVPYMTGLACQAQYLTRYMDNAKNKFDEWQPGLMPIEVLRLRVYKEYCLESPRNSTESVCEAFDADHLEDNPELYYYGDSNGLSRMPGLGGLTNFKIVERDLANYIHNKSKRVKHPNVAPNKRRDLLEAIFQGKFPEIEIQIDEACVKLIKDLEKLKQGINGKVKKKVTNKETGETYEELGHTSDALEYFVSELLKEYIKLA